MMMRKIQIGIEYAVGLVSPRRANTMAHFRRMRENEGYRETIFAVMRARGYEAARSGSDWLGGNTRGDDELLNDLPSMRARSRELDRDDSIGSGILTLFEQQVVTRELIPQARTSDREKNRRLEEIWRERKNKLFAAEAISMGHAQRRTCRCKLRDGDVFIKGAYTDNDPLWLELVEGDRVGSTQDDNDSVAGVVKDKHGRPTGYRIAKNGKRIGGMTLPSITKDGFTTIDISVCFHSKRGGRGGLTRGEPIFHAILQDIRDLDLLMLAVLKRTQIAACLAVFIESAENIDAMMDATADQYGYQLKQKLEPGMIWKTNPGDKISTLIPNFPLPDLLPYCKILACRIGAAVGISWEYVMRMFSEDSYSAGRTAQLASEPTWDAERQDQIEDIWTNVWELVMADAALRGDPRMAGIAPYEMRQVRWQADGRKWVDPAKQAKEKETKRKLLIETWQQQCVENGTDATDNLDQIEELIDDVMARGRIPEPMKEKLILALIFGTAQASAPEAPAAEDTDEPEKPADDAADEENDNA